MLFDRATEQATGRPADSPDSRAAPARTGRRRRSRSRPRLLAGSPGRSRRSPPLIVQGRPMPHAEVRSTEALPDWNRLSARGRTSGSVGSRPATMRPCTSIRAAVVQRALRREDGADEGGREQAVDLFAGLDERGQVRLRGMDDDEGALGCRSSQGQGLHAGGVSARRGSGDGVAGRRPRLPEPAAAQLHEAATDTPAGRTMTIARIAVDHHVIEKGWPRASVSVGRS